MPPTIADYKSPMFPTWCPGCGDFGIWQAIKQALVNLGKDPHEVCIVYGIGCSGNMSSFVRAYGFHSLHGRALASAFGIKLANPRLTVIVVAGDGDTYSEGIQHFLGAIRQNIDINFLVHDNHTFSLTTGQASPTSDQGRKTKVTPAGAPDRPLYPLPLAISQEASFVARGLSGFGFS
jgi:2-oxoglutarate ferredoxin oxidoreductase subunit beta